jgi:hypothetical protein
MTKKRGPQPHQCAVPHCTNPATLIVMLEDFSSSALHRRGPWSGEPNFCEPDKSLPYICTSCAEKNEDESTGTGRSRHYPFSKWGAKGAGLCGWTTYRDIKTKKEVFV